MKRIKDIFTNNLGLKLLALVFSIALWIIVVNVDDPSQSKNFTATVQVINAEVLANQGKYYSKRSQSGYEYYNKYDTRSKVAGDPDNPKKKHTKKDED